MTKGYRSHRGVLMNCPHCGSVSYSRTSKTVTELYRELYYGCTNLECGHTWKASLAFVHTISPSAVPRLELNLPVSTPIPANDRHPATLPVTPRHNANDDDVAQGKAVGPENTAAAITAG